MVISTSTYPFINEIINEYNSILLELNNVLKLEGRNIGRPTWVSEPDFYQETKDGWKTFTFKIFGIKYLQNLELCPTIATILEKYPFIITAEFSLLDPGAKILPHKGFTDQFNRAHLGLVIPKGDLGLKFENDLIKWEEGKVVVFNDYKKHEAWNNTDETRVVFMFDFDPDLSEEKGLKTSKRILQTTNYFNHLAPREQWLQWFEKGFFEV